MRFLSPVKSLLALVLFVSLLFPLHKIEKVHAATLTSMSVVISNNTALASGVTHTVNFTTATTDNLKRVTFRFSTTQGGTTKPASLNLASATLGTVTNLGNNWTLNTSSASSGILYIERTSPGSINSGSAASVQLQNITNSAIDDCDTGNAILEDTCHVRISTFSDDGSTLVDSGDTTYMVDEDPYVTFLVEDVASGQTNNGVTSNISTSSTSISFGRLQDGTVRRGTHKLTITTNAPRGYSVTAELSSNITGTTYPAYHIDPFGATNATWTNPVTWSSPTGTSINNDTGWFGANTSDTTISGWASGSGKFGPLGTTARSVIEATGPDRTGSVIYVSYAVEVNELQAYGDYAGELFYNVKPLF